MKGFDSPDSIKFLQEKTIFYMNRNSYRELALVLIAAFLFPSGLDAAEIEGAYFKERLTVDKRTLYLNGAGLFRYWGFKAYVGALYLEEGSNVKEALSERSKRIEIEYMRPIQGKDFGPATDKSIAKNVDSGTLKRLRPQNDHHNSLYEDVQPGHRYTLTYVPGKGTELALNDEPKGIIEGADFASAVFSIWLGPEPIRESFKKQILGL